MKEENSINFIIRRAEQYEKEAIKNICRASFDPLYGYFAIRSLNLPNQVLVADIKGRIVGFAKLRLIRINKDLIGNILWIAVLPEFRQKGIATALIEAALNCFKNFRVKKVYVSVRKDNSIAHKLFKKEGFRKIGFRELKKLYGYSVIKFYLKTYTFPTEFVLVKLL
jgi:ribosomal-protein-alanine N-acetyltransferase